MPSLTLACDSDPPPPPSPLIPTRSGIRAITRMFKKQYIPFGAPRGRFLKYNFQI